MLIGTTCVVGMTVLVWSMNTTPTTDLSPIMGLPIVLLAGAGIVLALMAILMPYYVYRSAVELAKLRKIAQRWEQWMRSQN